MLLLASRSPRRRALLARLGVPFAVLDVEVPERRADTETAEGYVCRVARDKALAGLRAATADTSDALVLAADTEVVLDGTVFCKPRDAADALVLAADTEVVLDGDVFGKPRDAEDAAAMLRRLSARVHEVLTAVTLVAADGREASALSRSRLQFAALDDATIARYVASGESLGKAGGYAIQGFAECFVIQLTGSHSGVMGLPLHETARLLAGFGIETGGAATSRQGG